MEPAQIIINLLFSILAHFRLSCYNCSNCVGKEHSVEMIYWMTDQLYPKIDAIKKMTFNKTKSLFREKIDLLLFDVTTLYFESVEMSV